MTIQLMPQARMRYLLAVVFVLGLSAPALSALSSTAAPFTLEYRWVGEGVAGRTHAVPRPATTTPFQLSDSVVLNLAGVDTAEVRVRGDVADVFIRLTTPAIERFADATAAHIGHDLAVLVNGTVVQVATVESRLGRVAGVLSGVSRDSAEAMAASINRARTPRRSE